MSTATRRPPMTRDQWRAFALRLKAVRDETSALYGELLRHATIREAEPLHRLYIRARDARHSIENVAARQVGEDRVLTLLYGEDRVLTLLYGEDGHGLSPEQPTPDRRRPA